MSWPKLSPLQSRLAASLLACALVLLLYLTLSLPTAVYAFELDFMPSEDHNHEGIAERPYIDSAVYAGEREVEAVYEPSFLGIDRGIVGRQQAAVLTNLPNNIPYTINVEPGGVQYFHFSNTSLHETISGPSTALPSSIADVRRRMNDSVQGVQDDRIRPPRLERRQTTEGIILYITANTCQQPSAASGSSASRSPAPQLEMYISTTTDNQYPGPSKTTNQEQVIFTEGYAGYTMNTTSDVYISIHAPNSTLVNGVYNLQIAGSIDSPYHVIHNFSTNLHLIDSDTQSALLVTDNLTTSDMSPAYEEWMSIEPPFSMFVFDSGDNTLYGLSNSYCYLSKHAAATTYSAVSSMTNITENNSPKQQFYVTGLNGSTTYIGMLAMSNTSTTEATIGGGGSLWPSMSFSTQSDGACSVIYNLSFCTQVAYAVPGNKQTFPSATSLATWYDNQALSYYSFFNNVLQQIPCEIESSSQYSLASTCDDCATAYKAWLCSVTIPRCMDFTSPLSYLQERNMVQAFPNGSTLSTTITDPVKDLLYLNSSRFPAIDVAVMPGPYKELLPCEGLCYDLVRTCPAAMGFSCPQPGMLGFGHSYGQMPNQTQAGMVTCNYPGAVYGVSGGLSLASNRYILAYASGLAVLITMFSA